MKPPATSPQSYTTKGLVWGASEIGEDVATVARKAVIALSRQRRRSVYPRKDAASAAATGAVEAGERIDKEASSAIRKAVAGVIGGLKVVVKEPFSRKKEK